MKQVSFCVGTGRCGTTFITRLAELEPNVAAGHERLRLAATFHMFCKWHQIPADPEGFLIDRQTAVEADLEDHEVSFESSALLSHSIAELHQRFDARFLLLVRRPDHTVASFAARNWFADPIVWNDPTVIPTIRDATEPRHFLGRNLPRGEAFHRWSQLSQIGRIAWFWQARNGGILEQFRQLPPSHCRILRLEDFDHAGYCQAARFLGWTPTISLQDFERLAGQRPNVGPNLPQSTSTWSDEARADFEQEVAGVAKALGYQTQLEVLEQGTVLATPPPIVADALERLG